MSSENIVISFYENEVPSFVEAELDRLYGNVFSSLPQFLAYGGVERMHTYVARDGSHAIAVFLLRREKTKVQVINEGITIDAQEMTRFCRYIFTVFKAVSVISFHAIQVDTQRLPFPAQCHHCTEDSVISLPRTAQEYLAQLGPSTRKNLKRHLNRIRRDFPSFDYRVYAREEVDEQRVRDIIKLNCLRMASKNKVSTIDARETERIIQMVKMSGFVGVGTIDGQLCAGGITYRFGNNYFSFVKAHDPKYDDYSLGMLNNYLIICECIARSGKEFHLMWGREPHKALLQGIQRDLDHVVVFRSRADVLRNAGIVLETAITGYMRRIKIWLLHDAKHENSVIARLGVKSLCLIRSVKRVKPRSLSDT